MRSSFCLQHSRLQRAFILLVFDLSTMKLLGLVLASLALAVTALKPKPQPFCCPKTGKSTDQPAKVLDWQKSSLDSDHNILVCKYGPENYCQYTLVPIGTMYKAGELKAEYHMFCNNYAETLKSRQGLGCQPAWCCPLTVETHQHHQGEKRNLAKAEISATGRSLICEYETAGGISPHTCAYNANDGRIEFSSFYAKCGGAHFGGSTDQGCPVRRRTYQEQYS